MIDIGMLTSWGIAVIGMTVWAVRLEGRVNTQIARHDDLREFFDERLAKFDRQLDRIENRLQERRVNGPRANDN
jgi:ribosome-associated translation inhibitor RaiA